LQDEKREAWSSKLKKQSNRISSNVFKDESRHSHLVVYRVIATLLGQAFLMVRQFHALQWSAKKKDIWRSEDGMGTKSISVPNSFSLMPPMRMG
jgi:hypothetical protein